MLKLPEQLAHESNADYLHEAGGISQQMITVVPIDRDAPSPEK